MYIIELKTGVYLAGWQRGIPQTTTKKDEARPYRREKTARLALGDAQQAGLSGRIVRK